MEINNTAVNYYNVKKREIKFEEDSSFTHSQADEVDQQ